MSRPAVTVELAALTGGGRLLGDERLARRAAEGDERAFAAIYRRYNQDLYRYARTIVGNSEDAQDVLQATMVKAVRKLPGERREIQLKPWLYRVAHNEAVDLMRRRPGTGPPAVEEPAAGPLPEEEAEQRQRLRDLLTDLDQLPARQRWALVMRELSGLEFAEIAAALETSPAVIRQTIYEARLNLRQMEEGRGLQCASVTRALSDADGRVSRRRDLRAHLRECESCRRFREDLRSRRDRFAAVAPLPAIAGAALLKGAAGANGGGAGLLGGIGAAAGGSSLVVKSAATVAVIAAVGASVADREGLIDLAPRGDGGGGSAALEPGGGSTALARAALPAAGAGVSRGAVRGSSRVGDGGESGADARRDGGAGVAGPEDRDPSGNPGVAGPPGPGAGDRGAGGGHGGAHPSPTPGQAPAPAATGGGEAGAEAGKGAPEGSGGEGAGAPPPGGGPPDHAGNPDAPGPPGELPEPANEGGPPASPGNSGSTPASEAPGKAIGPAGGDGNGPPAGTPGPPAGAPGPPAHAGPPAGSPGPAAHAGPPTGPPGLPPHAGPPASNPGKGAKK